MKIYYAANISPGIRKILLHSRIKDTCDKAKAHAIYMHFEDIDFSEFPNLKYVLCPATNINHLKNLKKDIKIIYLDNKIYLFKYVQSTAEMCMWGTLNLLKRTHTQQYGLLDELNDKIVGFVGFGRIAQQFARMLIGFGVKNIYYYDPNPYLYLSNMEVRYVTFIDFNTLLEFSDIISINCTADVITKDLISDDEFDIMAKQPYFINTSRGSVVNGKALLRAVSYGKITGFYLDVIDSYDNETLLELYKYAKSGHSFITQHIAGKGRLSRESTDLYVAEQLIKDIRSD